MTDGVGAVLPLPAGHDASAIERPPRAAVLRVLRSRLLTIIDEGNREALEIAQDQGAQIHGRCLS
jgi:hypothetical protein